MLFSEPKIPQFRLSPVSEQAPSVSVLFSEPKIPQFVVLAARRASSGTVSVLFSEPKIPQLDEPTPLPATGKEFQCSSASRKFLNATGSRRIRRRRRGFSALQRAENSSIIDAVQSSELEKAGFSALQRAENSSISSRVSGRCGAVGFSALQRAENSSILSKWTTSSVPAAVSVLFSEPKIPQ